MVKLKERIDNLRPNWYLWSCEKGGVIGTVQADTFGEMIAEDSFEPDELTRIEFTKEQSDIIMAIKAEAQENS